MKILHNAETPNFKIQGIAHQTLAGARDGLSSVEIWRQIIAPGGASPVHRHDCEEVLVMLEGKGVCKTADEVFEFGQDDTVCIPPNTVHQISNNSDVDLCIVATLAMSPVRVETADGQEMALPWDAPTR
ncbi:MAG: cupin domain-containing protein [Gammaproteobacteria bacterium]